MEEILKLSDVHKVYKNNEIEVHALKGINLKVKKGDFLVILGPSGSGKTTLLNLIAGLDKPTKGEIYFKDYCLNDLNEDQLANLRLKEIGFIFQSYNLIPWLNAIENVMLPMMLLGYKEKNRIEKANELLKLVGLEHRKKHKPYELSGGEQQRIAIARALSNDPSLILADEPTGNLDYANAKSIFDLLLKINSEKKVTIIMVTHDVELAKNANRVIRMRDGIILDSE
jgi:putative ABC transport system ATP-binding protein